MAVHISIELVYSGEVPEWAKALLWSKVDEASSDPAEFFDWLGGMLDDNPGWAVLATVSDVENEGPEDDPEE